MSTVAWLRDTLRLNKRAYERAHAGRDDARKERLKRQRRMLERLLQFEQERAR